MLSDDLLAKLAALKNKVDEEIKAEKKPINVKEDEDKEPPKPIVMKFDNFDFEGQAKIIFN